MHSFAEPLRIKLNFISHQRPKKPSLLERVNAMEEARAFEFFYLEELLAEGIISKMLFDATRKQLEIEMERATKYEEEMEL